MAKSLQDSIKTYLSTLGTKSFGRNYDLNQEKSLNACVSWLANHWLKIKEEVDKDSYPTDEAIHAARSFNTDTNTFYASARNDRVILSLPPEVAKAYGKKIGKADEN